MANLCAELTSRCNILFLLEKCCLFLLSELKREAAPPTPVSDKTSVKSGGSRFSDRAANQQQNATANSIGNRDGTSGTSEEATSTSTSEQIDLD